MARKLLLLAYILSYLIFPALVLELPGGQLANIPLRLAVFCILALGGAVLFTRAWPKLGLGTGLVFTALGYGTIYKLASFIPDISTYPFSLAWSEASRYYYASLWLSKQAYGFFIPPSVLHPSRYLLQSIPLLIPNSPLWLSRSWQVALWLITSALTSWLLVRRLSLASHKRPLVISLSFSFWAFLFLFQGPVYYHLLVMVIAVLWGFNRTRFWRSLVIVLFASLWAGISRVNWLPMPGFLAATLYLMEEKIEGKTLWRYLVPPGLWVLAGTGAAYASQLAYQLWSGNPSAWFGSSFTSDLLWYRLLPNPTFPMGILPSAVLVSLPLAFLILLRLSGRLRAYHPIRWLGLAAILVVLFAGGVVVSVKIGGGSNLHNLDGYLVMLMVVGSYVYFGRFQPDHSTQVSEPGVPPASKSLYSFAESLLLTATLALPLYFTLSAGNALPHRDALAAQADLKVINAAAQQVTRQGGAVLFISQRQLLTFNQIPDVPLVPDYELVFLMEMAMSDNPAYMDAFRADISSQRFALIVSEPLVIQYQGRNHAFGEENDAWVERVSTPVLCYYEPRTKLEAAGVVLYFPRPTPCQ